MMRLYSVFYVNIYIQYFSIKFYLYYRNVY